jgi:Aminoglycoside-2''-adenylyltransferase
MIETNSLESIIRAVGKKLNGKVSTPIVVGGWAVNLLGQARATIDFDFMIFEDEFKIVADIMHSVGYRQTVKTGLYARFESADNSELAYFDCLFANRHTYDKLVQTGKEVDIFGAKFILPEVLNIIAMKLHAVKYGNPQRFAKDFNDIIALIEINNIDISSSIFMMLCEKYGNNDIYRRITDAVDK